MDMTSRQLLRIMEEKGWSRAHVAGLVRVHERTVRRWMNGEIDIPDARAEHIKLLAERETVRA